MYEFTDSIEVSTNSLPAEAMRINGEYIENLINGYQTLHVSGREAMAQEVSSIDVGDRSGSFFQKRRYPERKIVVAFQLVAESNSAFREAFTKLNHILDCEEAELIFADEADKFFIGTPSEVGEIEPGNNAVVGEITFTCSDPFKYSVEEYVVDASEDSENGDYFAVNYHGTHRAYPKFETHFMESDEQDNSDGDCGYIAFVNSNGNVLQFGDPAEPDGVIEKVDEIMTKPAESRVWTDKSKYTLINEGFNALTGWVTNAGMTSDTSKFPQVGSARVAPININGATDKAAQGSTYGSGSAWHGPTITKTLPSDAGNPATVGAVDWTMNLKLRFCAASNASNAKKQMSVFQVWIMDGSSYVAGLALFKSSGATTGTIRCYIRGNGAVKDWVKQDFSYYNARFGLAKKSSDKRPLNIDIIKSGSKVTFNAGGLSFSYSSPTVTNLVAKKVCLYFGQWASNPVMLCNAVYNLQFYSNSRKKTASTAATWEDIMGEVDKPNVFTTNDVLVADCSDGSIRMTSATADEDATGRLAPELGAIGNQWEEFYLEPGMNQIGIGYSDWVTDAHKPTFKMKYREVFL